MKKHNVIEIAAYRDEGNVPARPANEISDELKEAIEVLIEKLRTAKDVDFNQ